MFLKNLISSYIFNTILRRHTNFLEITFSSSFKGSLLVLFRILRDMEELQFKSLMDLFVVDYLKVSRYTRFRFAVIFNLLSIKKNRRLVCRFLLSEDDITLPSLVTVFEAAAWLERESWDLFGIFFSGNPDLRRILTDYGFSGFPLRKDFPLTGYVEVRFDDELKRVVFDELEVSQEYRMFDFLSPWEKI